MLFTCYLNHDYNFFGRLADVSRSWEQRLREKHPEAYIVAGGSSARTGLDPQILLDEYQIPFINGATGAGYGFDAIAALGWEYVQAHDTLILAIEKELIASRAKATTYTHGIRMIFQQRGFGVYNAPFLEWSWKNRFKPFDMSSVQIATYVVRNLTRKKDEVFRYHKHAQIHPSGWMEVTLHCPMQPQRLSDQLESLSAYNIGLHARDGYERVKQECRKHQVRLIAMIPRYYAHESMRAVNLWLALQITRMGIKVLYDPELSVVTSSDLFSDTPHHLNKQGAIQNTRQLGDSLSKQAFWTEEGLIAALAQLGWDKDGKRLRKVF